MNTDTLAPNVVHLPGTQLPPAERTPLAPLHSAPQPIQDRVPTLVAGLVTQTNAENRQLANKLHSRMKPWVTRINRFTGPMREAAQEAMTRYQEWSDHDRHATHVPFIGKRLLWTLMLLTLIGEWMLAATVLNGLGMQDWERYLMSAGIVGVAFALTKAIANGLRVLLCEYLETPRQRWAHVAMLVIGVAVLCATVYAMSEARSVYSAEANAMASLDGAAQLGAPDSTVATSAGMAPQKAHGLTLLQAVLYFGQVVVFWFLGATNTLAERARRNYQAARAHLQGLHRQRNTEAAKLNRLVAQGRAKWEQNVEEARTTASFYLRYLAAAGGSLPQGTTQEIRRDWFDASHTHIDPQVDAVPPIVQQVLAGLERSAPGTVAAAADAPDGLTEGDKDARNDPSSAA